CNGLLQPTLMIGCSFRADRKRINPGHELRFQERIEHRSNWDAQLTAASGRLEGCGCGSKNNSVAQREFLSQRRSVSAVKNIATTGGVHRIHFKSGLMPDYSRRIFPEIPATCAAGGDDHGF